MCDTLVSVEPGRVLFAKNSDRDANEAQILDWRPAREHPAGDTVRCTWLEIPQVRRTHAVLLSRPFWMWGAEMGANEHGLVIGNEAVFPRLRLPAAGLTGMDLLRLALERAASAAEAVEVIGGLLAEHPQGGGCGHERRSFRYSSSFLIADPEGAIVLETAGRRWHAEPVAQGVRTLSNAYTMPRFVERERRLHALVARAARRRARTAALCRVVDGPADLAAALRDHGPGADGPRWRPATGTLGAPCMHGGGWLASSVTTASWISELRPGGASRHWATATAAPCLSLFKPVRVDAPIELGTVPCDRADGSLWWRHERLHRALLRDWSLARPLLEERDTLERRWWDAPPDPATAFAAHDAFLAKQGQALRVPPADRRPREARAWWRRRERAAGSVAF